MRCSTQWAFMSHISNVKKNSLQVYSAKFCIFILKVAEITNGHIIADGEFNYIENYVKSHQIFFLCVYMSSVCMGPMFNKVFGVDCWIIFRSIFLSEATSNNFILQYWRLRRFRNLWKTWNTLPLMFLTWSWIKDGSKIKILLSWNNPNIAFINSDILMVLIVSARTSCSWQ